MSDAAVAAAKLLDHNLEVMKKSAEVRDRRNLKQQLEECQALLRIIVRFQRHPRSDEKGQDNE